MLASLAALRKTPLLSPVSRCLNTVAFRAPLLANATQKSPSVAGVFSSTRLPGLALGPSGGTGLRGGGLGASALGAIREKQTKRSSYRKPPRAKPCGQRLPNRGHIGVKALSSEYVEVGRVICKQRKFIAKNPFVTRKRNFKLYPGVNVNVMKSTSLQAAVSGRVKFTHDVERDVMIMNVLAEPREELLRDETWRYRTEHIQCMEENRVLCSLRAKAFTVFGKEEGWVNPPLGPKPMRAKISKKRDGWNNPHVQDPYEVEPFAYPLTPHLLARHIRKVRRKHAGLPDDDEELEVTDTRYHLFHGQSAQR